MDEFPWGSRIRKKKHSQHRVFVCASLLKKETNRVRQRKFGDKKKNERYRRKTKNQAKTENIL